MPYVNIKITREGVSCEQKAALIAGGVFLLWRTARGLRSLGWTAFGLGMAAYWTGFWPF